MESLPSVMGPLPTKVGERCLWIDGQIVKESTVRKLMAEVKELRELVGEIKAGAESAEDGGDFILSLLETLKEF